MALGDEWDFYPDGDIPCCPVAGWSTATMQHAGLLRVEHFPDAEALTAGTPAAIQFAIPASQLRLLAEDLLTMADQIDQRAMGVWQ
jgi:hypothetical protein